MIHVVNSGTGLELLRILGIHESKISKDEQFQDINK